MSNTPEAASAPSPFLATAIEAVSPRRRIQLDASAPDSPCRQEGRHRSRDRGRPGRRTHVPRAGGRAVSRITTCSPKSRARRHRASRRRGTAGFSIRLTARPTLRTGCRFSVRRWALEIDGDVEVGCRLRPHRGELFTAERGSGALLNGEPSRCRPRPAGRCPAGHRFPYAVHEDAEEMVGLFGASSRARAVRRLGSAALDMCYVAAGRMEGFWERGLGPWDIAAGALHRRGSRRPPVGSRRRPVRAPIRAVGRLERGTCTRRCSRRLHATRPTVLESGRSDPHLRQSTGTSLNRWSFPPLRWHSACSSNRHTIRQTAGSGCGYWAARRV